MTTGLKIGDRLFDADQLITALIQYKLMDTLIGNVLLDEAIQAIAVSQAEIWQRLTGSDQSISADDFDSFLTQWCADQELTPAYFQGVVLREWRIEKFKQQYFANQLESEFLNTKPSFDQVVYSVLQVESSTLARELYYQVRDDAIPFSALVSYSLGTERDTEGCLGPVPLATVPPALLPLLQPNQVGVVHKPIPIGDRFWVVRLEQFIPARLTEATRRELTNRLFDRWLQSKINDLRTLPNAIALQPSPAAP